jgi:hypothetical protein
MGSMIDRIAASGTHPHNARVLSGGRTMNRTAAGVFETGKAAGEVVRELERLGISGEQVEVVNDAAYDVRGEGIVPKPKRDEPDSQGEEYTVVIVRPTDDVGMEQAKNLMDRYGAKLFRWQISVDGATSDTGIANRGVARDGSRSAQINAGGNGRT